MLGRSVSSGDIPERCVVNGVEESFRRSPLEGWRQGARSGAPALERLRADSPFLEVEPSKARGHDRRAGLDTRQTPVYRGLHPE